MSDQDVVGKPTHTVTCDVCQEDFECDLPQPHTCKAICIPCLRDGLRNGTLSLKAELMQPVTIQSDGPVRMIDEGMWFSDDVKPKA